MYIVVVGSGDMWITNTPTSGEVGVISWDSLWITRATLWITG